MSRFLALQRDAAAVSVPENVKTVEVAMPCPLDIYDLRARRPLGRHEKLELTLNAGQPVLLALAENAFPPPSIAGPYSAHLGDDGNPAVAYSGNVLLVEGTSRKLLPLAANDKTGVWSLRATDMLSGATTVAELKVEP